MSARRRGRRRTDVPRRKLSDLRCVYISPTLMFVLLTLAWDVVIQFPVNAWKSNRNRAHFPNAISTTFLDLRDVRAMLTGYPGYFARTAKGRVSIAHVRSCTASRTRMFSFIFFGEIVQDAREIMQIELYLNMFVSLICLSHTFYSSVFFSSSDR